MKQGFRGFLVGVSVTLALAVTVAYAVDPELDKPKNQLTHDFISEVNKLVNNYCEVYVGTGRITAGPHCGRNQVMTGYDNINIYCSDVAVDCFSTRKMQANDYQQEQQ